MRLSKKKDNAPKQKTAADVILFSSAQDGGKRAIPIKAGGLKRGLPFWCLLFIVMQACFFSHGFKYFPYADDFNQYGVFYKLSSNIWQNVIMHYRSYNIRPLAFFADAYIIARFWNHLPVVLFFMTTLHFAILFMLNRVFAQCGLKFGKLAAVVFGLAPVLYEASYWISASSRIVVGLFFGVLSVYMFTLFTDKAEKDEKGASLRLTLFGVFGLIAVGFYEQTAVLTFALSVLVIILNRKKLSRFAFIYSLAVPIFNAAVIIGYYAYFMLTEVKTDARASFFGDFAAHAAEMLKEMARYFGREQINLTVYSVKQGFSTANLYVIIFFAVISVIIFCVLTFAPKVITVYINGDARRERVKSLLARMLAGVLLAAAPLVIFFALPNSYFSTRAVFPSFLGIAIAVETLFDAPKLIDWRFGKKRVLSFERVWSSFKWLTLSACVCAFALANVHIVNVYKKTAQNDKAIAENFLAAFEDVYKDASADEKTETALNVPVLLLNAKVTYNGEDVQPVLHNITAEDWRFLGYVNAVSPYKFTKAFLVREGAWFDGSLSAKYPSFGIFGDLRVESIRHDAQ